MTGGGLLELAPGSGLLLNGVCWTVEEVLPQTGQVRLRNREGESRERSIRWLMHHPDARPAQVAKARSPDSSGQPAEPADLSADQLARARLRAEHVLEAETGYRLGDASRALPGEPRSAYDPLTTTVTERRRAKAAGLQALDRDEAARLGLARMSVRTLERLAATGLNELVMACADGRWTRRSGGHPSITEEIREAIFAVRRECVQRSRISMRARHRLLHQYIRETFPKFPPEDIPGRTTLTTVWREWFGPDGARQRYVRSAEAAKDASQRVVVHRPGQVVALDSTPLPVKVLEEVFGDPVSVMLTLALDLYTHSIVAFRLTLVSDTSVDIAMLLRDVMMPLPMREGWGEEMEWPYPGVPAAVVAQFAGHKVAALPFFAPETVTTDHGGPYKNHHVVEAERTLGCNILPARALRPTDKFAIERCFSAVKSLLLEHLLGFTGTDVADRGADPEADAVLSMAQMESLIAAWIVRVWQNRILGEYAPAWGPGEDNSPNTLFAAAMQQGGFALQIPKPELYYRLLKAHHVMIHPGRGVKTGGLWYHHPVLDEGRFRQPSARGGRHKGKWVVRSDRRDRRTVFLQDPAAHDLWHPLRWTGLPPEGEVPAFSDKTAEALLGEVRRRRLAPRTDAELLPVLLELLGSAIPVEQWPASSVSGLHPAQCRNTVSGLPGDPLCTTRLDGPHETHHPALTPNIANLQRWILDLLDAAHPPTPALTALTDLHTISAVVCATWPAAATVTPETKLVHALDEHITQQQQTPAASLTPTAKSYRWATPPQSSAATAGLLDIAARLIALPLEARHHAITALLERASVPATAGWGKTWARHRASGSPALQAQIQDGFARRLSPNGVPRRRRDAPIRPVHPRGYLPEHIPQWLPNDWFTFLTEDTRPRPMGVSRSFRRFCALQLVQITTGMPRHQAARFLGIPDAWHQSEPLELPDRRHFSWSGSG